MDETVIDLKKLPARINAARLSFGSADLMHAVLGVTPGSVSPLALLNDSQRQVSPFLDHRLMEHEVMNCLLR